MIRSDPVAEYSLEEKSAKTYPQWDHSKITSPPFEVGLEEVRRLYQVCTLLVDISEGIRDSVRALEQSQRELV